MGPRDKDQEPGSRVPTAQDKNPQGPWVSMGPQGPFWARFITCRLNVGPLGPYWVVSVAPDAPKGFLVPHGSQSLARQPQSLARQSQSLAPQHEIAVWPGSFKVWSSSLNVWPSSFCAWPSRSYLYGTSSEYGGSHGYARAAVMLLGP